MDRIRITFRTSTQVCELIDELAEADHRDRNSMLAKMVDTYLKDYVINGKRKATQPSKKAGSR
jgi:predicted transcriptional regulator